MKKVSIVVPVYNIEKYLPECIESIIAQTYKNIEIICIDDGSTDNSAEVVRSFMKKDERIVFVQQKNGGLSCARNTGIENATGEYIVFVDGDDWIDSETVESALKYDADLVLWSYTSEFGEKSVKKEIFSEDKEFNLIECKNLLQRRMIGLAGKELAKPENFDAVVTAWGKMYRTDIIKDNKLFFVDTKIIGTEDAFFNLQYTQFCKKAFYINKSFNHYRKDNRNSLTRTYKPNLFSQWQTLYSKISDYIAENNCSESFTEALDNRICWSIVGLGLTELLNENGFTEQIENIRKILRNGKYCDAYKKLSLEYFPLHWKLFFFCCKRKMSVAVFILLKAVNYLIEK